MSLPTIQTANLADAIAESSYTPTQSGGSEMFAQFNQDGDYTLGTEKEIITGEEVTVHTDTLAIGWACWVDGQVHKEYVNFLQPLPPKPAAIAGNEFTEARAIAFRLEDGVIAILEKNTYGMRQGVDALIMKIRERAINPDTKDYLYPVVKLDASSYKNKKNGNTIYNPVFQVLRWVNAEGEVYEETKKLEDSSEAEPKPKARRRRSAA